MNERCLVDADALSQLMWCYLPCGTARRRMLADGSFVLRATKAAMFAPARGALGLALRSLTAPCGSDNILSTLPEECAALLILSCELTNIACLCDW